MKETYEQLRERAKKLNWGCRFHPVNWWHQVGCPHQEWTREDLYSALITKVEFEEGGLRGKILDEKLARKLGLNKKVGKIIKR